MDQQARSASVRQAPPEEQRHPSTNAEIRQLLQSWLEGDVEEHRETWALLKQALDEDRPAVRKLFP
jgi:hypothetical protein